MLLLAVILPAISAILRHVANHTHMHCARNGLIRLVFGQTGKRFSLYQHVQIDLLGCPCIGLEETALSQASSAYSKISVLKMQCRKS